MKAERYGGGGVLSIGDFYGGSNAAFDTIP
jgi:hypothetical protein